MSRQLGCKDCSGLCHHHLFLWLSTLVTENDSFVRGRICASALAIQYFVRLKSELRLQAQPCCDCVRGVFICVAHTTSIPFPLLPQPLLTDITRFTLPTTQVYAWYVGLPTCMAHLCVHAPTQAHVTVRGWVWDIFPNLLSTLFFELGYLTESRNCSLDSPG